MGSSLAIKYRPKTWDDVTEQKNVKAILSQQLKTNTMKHAYLFCGGAGTGKTTCARIFAHEINKGIGTPFEMDAASHNSVDDIREISQQARKKPLEGDYNVFILDECHVLSGAAWQAMLKLLEEPPAVSIFIFCTTNPEKIPKTILSRVQRYDFQRISQQGIIDRLAYIMIEEKLLIPHSNNDTVKDALEYLAKLAEGGMRDAITLLDKCLDYSKELTLENVMCAVGAVDYKVMFDLLDALYEGKPVAMFDIIESIYLEGKDIKLFVKSFTNFVLDVCKYGVTESLDYTQIPTTYQEWFKTYDSGFYAYAQKVLAVLLRLNTDIKWESSPKAIVEANLFQLCYQED